MEIECLGKLTEKFEIEGIRKALTSLEKLYKKQVKAEIFSNESLNRKEAIISSVLSDTRVIYETITN